MMGITGAWGLLAVAFAGACGGCVGTWGIRRARMKLHASTSLGLSRREQMLLAVRAAGRPMRPLARRLLRIVTVRSIVHEACHGLSMEEKLTAEEACSVVLAASLLSGLAAFLLTLSPVFATAIVCIVLVSAGCWARHVAVQERQAMREAVPDALRSLADSFQSGHSLVQTLQQASADLHGRLALLFSQAANRLKAGETTSEALAALKEERDVPELAFVAVALDVQHQSGGSIAPVLESARRSVEDELELMRSLRVQTAQARLSATIVTIMPFLLVAFFSLASPDFLAPFFDSALGLLLLIMALVMQLGGVLAVRRICRVDE